MSKEDIDDWDDLPETQTQQYHSQQTIVGVNKITGPMPWARLYALMTGVETLDVTGPTVSLGRSMDCTITIRKSSFPENHITNISKFHFELVKEEGKPVFIYDYSKNGTFVNGVVIGRDKCNVLQNDDIIAIGHKDMNVYMVKLLDMEDKNYLPPILRTKYVPGQFLGKGACGEVRLVYEKATCKQFAIKKIAIGKYGSQSLHHINHPKKIKNEIQILNSLSHVFVIKMYDIIETDDDVFMVLEYMAGGELTNRIISKENPLNEAQCKFIFYQILLGVQYLHQNGITHRDLKPENVLLSSKNNDPIVKISDFGLSKMLEDEDMMRTTCGTPYYIAPEIIDIKSQRYYTSKVDVWSLGVILYFMLSKELPFQAETHHELHTLILNGKYSFDSKWRRISSSARDLVKRMLVVNPTNRIGIDDILNHPWLAHDVKVQYNIGRLINKYNNNDENAPPKKKRKVEIGEKRDRCTI